MPFYNIHNYPVYYSFTRFQEVDNLFINQYNKEHGREDAVLFYRTVLIEKTKQHRIDFLHKDFDRLGVSAFHDKWVKFRFKGEDARELAKDIIHLNLQMNNNGGVSFVFSEEGINIVNIEIEMKKIGLKWYQYLLYQPYRVNKHIEVRSIKKIEGTLDECRIHTKTEIIDLGKGICFRLKNSMSHNPRFY